MRELAGSDSTSAVIAIAWLSGMVDMLQSASMRESIKPGWGPFVVGLALFMGPLAGFAHLYISGRVVTWTSGWLGGVADTETTRAALAWGSVPEVTGLVLWIPGLAIFGEELFLKDTPRLDASRGLIVGVIVFFLAQVVLYVWAWVLRLAAVSEVQELSVGRTIGAVFLSWLLGILVLVAVVLGLIFALGRS